MKKHYGTLKNAYDSTKGRIVDDTTYFENIKKIFDDFDDYFVHYIMNIDSIETLNKKFGNYSILWNLTYTSEIIEFHALEIFGFDGDGSDEAIRIRVGGDRTTGELLYATIDYIDV